MIVISLPRGNGVLRQPAFKAALTNIARRNIKSNEIARMRYRSTAKQAPLTSLRGAVLRGLAPDGGLYMPVEIARRSPEELEEFRALPFTEVCFRVWKPLAGP